MNLAVPPGVDVYTTVVAGSGQVPRPPGENWSLVGVLVTPGGVVFVWSRSKIYAEAESAQKGPGPT